jgi:PAS domain S-box-containing protein
MKRIYLWLNVVAILCFVGGLLAYERYRAGEEIAKVENERLLHNAKNIESAFSNRLKPISASMGMVVVDLPNLVEGKPAGNPKLNHRLRVLVDTLTGVRSVVVVGKDGIVFGASRPELLGLNFKDSERYEAVRQRPVAQTLFLSEPFVTPLGTYTFSLGRAILDNSGAFNGYVLSIMDPDFLREVLELSQYEQGVHASIVHTGGKLLFRVGNAATAAETSGTQPDPVFVHHLQSGKQDTLNYTMGNPGEKRRLAVARTLNPGPLHLDSSLVIQISRDINDIYQEWNHDSVTLWVLYGVGSLVALFSVARYIRRRSTMERLEAARKSKMKAAQDRMRDAYDMLTLAERSAHAGAWKWDVRTNDLQWTPSLFQLFGLNPQTDSASFETWHRVLHPQDVEIAGAKVQESVATKQPLDTTYRIVLLSGEVRWIDAFGNPSYDEQGQPTVFAGFCVDVTQRVKAQGMLIESESRFRSLFENLPIAYQSLDIEGLWLDANQKLADLMGFDSPQQMLGLDFSTFWEEPYRSEFSAAFDEFKRTHNVEGEIQLRRRDGTVITVMISGRIQRDAQENFLRTHCIIVDISARRAMEDAMRGINVDLESKVLERTAELQEHRDHLERLVHERTRALAAAKDEAEHASKAKSVLLSNMNHELRTPLNHIIGFNNIIKQEITSTQGKERMDKVMTASNRLLKLINNLLDAAMLETQQLQLTGSDFNLNDLLDGLEKQAAGKLSAKGLVLQRELTLDLNLDAPLHGDFQRLTQVLDEILDNAIKFSSQGRIVLRSTQKHIASDLVSVRLEIEDQGVGIPVEKQANMFHLFVQEDGSTTRKYSGTGLGLALCQRIVNLMAGEIGLVSEPGKGTRVWIDTPLSLGKSVGKTGSALAGGWEDAREPLDELLWLLVSDDIEANLVWDEIEPKYGHLLGDSCFEIGKCIKNLDFAQAARLLAAELHRPVISN